MIDFLSFRKPLRYLGNEYNIPAKDFHAGNTLRICLCFPELYEVGMSNVGFRILYFLLNSFEGVICERCFLPGEDLRDHLLTHTIPLFSIETKTPLCDFDIIGFSINYELNYLQFLWMLYLGRIPLRTTQRKSPFVIAGGMQNPEPLWEFLDAVFIGEFEEQAAVFITAMRRLRYAPKEEKLEALSFLPGFYIPSFYRLEREQDGERIFPIKKNLPFPIERVYVKDLSRVFSPHQAIVPFIPIVHDRFSVEISRGCPHSCLFCQATKTYAPYREKEQQIVFEQAKRLYHSSGYEDMSLLGLSVADYSNIQMLTSELIRYFRPYGVKLSLPSLRLEEKTIHLLEDLIPVSSGSLTFAIEAATARLRRCIGKTIDIHLWDEIMSVVGNSFYTTIKTYFMIGLPSETSEDIEALCSMVEGFYLSSRKLSRKYIDFHLSISYFMPKPHSIFERESLENVQVVRDKFSAIRMRLGRFRRLKIDTPPLERCLVETLIARAGRELSVILEDVFFAALKGRLSYPDSFSLSLWRESLQKHSLLPESYWEKDTRKSTPWGHLG